MGRKATTQVNGSRGRAKPTPAAPTTDDPDLAEAELAESGEVLPDEGDPEVTPTDNVGEQSVEINVQELLAQLEAEGGKGVNGIGCARRKLEDYFEEKRIARELQDMDDFDI